MKSAVNTSVLTLIALGLGFWLGQYVRAKNTAVLQGAHLSASSVIPLSPVSPSISAQPRLKRFVGQAAGNSVSELEALPYRVLAAAVRQKTWKNEGEFRKKFLSNPDESEQDTKDLAAVADRSLWWVSKGTVALGSAEVPFTFVLSFGESDKAHFWELAMACGQSISGQSGDVDRAFQFLYSGEDAYRLEICYAPDGQVFDLAIPRPRPPNRIPQTAPTLDVFDRKARKWKKGPQLEWLPVSKTEGVKTLQDLGLEIE